MFPRNLTLHIIFSFFSYLFFIVHKFIFIGAAHNIYIYQSTAAEAEAEAEVDEKFPVLRINSDVRLKDAQFLVPMTTNDQRMVTP
jgi:hypothetical protein